VNKAQKAAYKADYAEAKAGGKPFFPYAVYKDHIVASLVIGLIIFLAIWAPAEVGPKIDPATETYVPRPEWYFLFLFELLKVFKNQNALLPVIMATFLVPNLLLGLLFAWPFLDRGPERRIHKRPFSIMVAVAVISFLGYMTYKGATTPEGAAAGTEIPIVVPESDADAFAGKTLVQEAGCLTCHSIGGVGGKVGPNLTNVGGKGIDYYVNFMKNPPGGVMPSFSAVPEDDLQKMATFLEGLGPKYK
jgi:mono/diheme cytochrome c family protein